MKRIIKALLLFLVIILGNNVINANSNKYELIGDKTGSYQTLAEVFSEIENSAGTNFNITMLEDDTIADSFIYQGIDKSKKISLTSKNQNVLTLASGTRHFSIYNADLTISNIIFDGQNINGGINAYSSNLVLNEATIFKNNYSTNSGGAIQLNNDSTLEINGASFDNNKTVIAQFGNGGSIYSYKSSITMNSGNISNSEAARGGAIYLTDFSKLTINDGSLNNNSQLNSDAYEDGTGGAIEVLDNSLLTINGGKFYQNHANNSGGAIGLGVVALGSGGSIYTPQAIINGGEFYENTARIGGAIALNKSAIMSINNADIHDNSSTGQGGAFFIGNPTVAGDFTLNINGGNIHDNTSATYGGAISIWNDLAKNITFITKQLDSNIPINIYNNTAEMGGALSLRNVYSKNTLNLTLELADLNVCDNTATVDGGALYLIGNTKANISSTIFNNNSASNNGGGLYLAASDSVVDMSSTKIENNKAISGGGIYTTNFSDYDNLTINDYQNIISDANTVFEGNLADKAYNPPSIASDYTNIKYKSSSIMTRGYVNPINNYDINYIGKDPVVTYTITYDANGGQGAFDESIVADGEYTILSDQAASIVREGYKFIGWNTKADGSGTTYQADDVINNVKSNLILYAQWQEIVVNKITPQAPNLDKNVECEQDYQVIIPSQEGVDYQVTKDGNTIKVVATPQDGYEFVDGVTSEWTFNVKNSEACPVAPPVVPDKPGPDGGLKPLPETGSNELFMIAVVTSLGIMGVILLRNCKN